uniref:Uncharacterized protein n=1 Tax=Helicotheca tamesis TaxID=374047 RepID=A0A6U0EEV3_9STRA|mmetsp:Transcript_11464/g.15901  ORF Transcript_11464/g.15901 Transcript_11464/m.15901 type:complete len:141 (+) Transcript_11464:231-653(+)
MLRTLGSALLIIINCAKKNFKSVHSLAALLFPSLLPTLGNPVPVQEISLVCPLMGLLFLSAAVALVVRVAAWLFLCSDGLAGDTLPFSLSQLSSNLGAGCQSTRWSWAHCRKIYLVCRNTDIAISSDDVKPNAKETELQY